MVRRCIARDLHARSNVPWSYVRASGLALSFEDKSFDLVLSNAVIEHVGGEADQARFVQEHARGGRRWIITTPNRWCPIEAHSREEMDHYRGAHRRRRRASASRSSRANYNDAGRWLADLAEQVPVRPGCEIRGAHLGCMRDIAFHPRPCLPRWRAAFADASVVELKRAKLYIQEDAPNEIAAAVAGRSGAERGRLRRQQSIPLRFDGKFSDVIVSDSSSHSGEPKGRMRDTHRVSVVVAIAAILASLFAVTANGAPPIAGPLHTSGNQILDANNQPIRLRGIAIERLNWYPYLDSSVKSLTPESFDAMNRWGVNAVRVFLGEQYWFSTLQCQYPISPAAYKANVDTVVQRITSRGMLAILDLHWNTKLALQPCSSAGQQRMADQARGVSFWQEVAGRYKTNPLVAFDLYNEPHDITWTQWKSGGTLIDSVVWTAAGMQALYNGVRGAGAQNLVFVSGNSWANLPPSSADILNGYNIVYAAHFYTCPANPPPECTTPDPYNPAPPGQRLNLWTPLSATHPIMVTEFGWPDPSSGTYNQNVINWAESRGVGWLAYTWEVPGTPLGFLANWTSYDPAPSGVPVKNGVALNL